MIWCDGMEEQFKSMWYLYILLISIFVLQLIDPQFPNNSKIHFDLLEFRLPTSLSTSVYYGWQRKCNFFRTVSTTAAYNDFRNRVSYHKENLFI